MPQRIGPRRLRRLYVARWREARGLTQEALANRMGVSGMTVSRWETGKALLNTSVMSALAEALDIEPVDLFRDPDAPSADAMLRGQPADVVDQAMRIIAAIRRTG